MIDLSNAQGLFGGSAVLCQPIPGNLHVREVFAGQDCQYTVVMRGQENGKAREDIRKVTSISRCLNVYEDYQAVVDVARSPDLRVVVSNTTEAGIVYDPEARRGDRPPVSFPAKLAALLYERYRALGDSDAAELLVLPVELIDDNGGCLRRFVNRHVEVWNLEQPFRDWLDKRVHIAGTLVDRIVTGFPKNEIDSLQDKLGYRDSLLVTCELFNLWVIEGDRAWADILPVDRTAANVIWTDDVRPYKKRKVRILNGAHTSTVPAAYLAGFDIVRDFMHDPILREYLRRLMYDEIIPTLDLPKKDLEDFAASVCDRFDNPYIDHRLLDILLNCSSKFLARCLPSLLDYHERRESLPPLLVFSLAAFIALYRVEGRDGKFTGRRQRGDDYEIHDDRETLEFFARTWRDPDPARVAAAVLANTALWDGRDLTAVPGLQDAVAGHIHDILRSDSMLNVVSGLLS